MVKRNDQTHMPPAEMSLEKAQRGHSYLITASMATGRNRMRMDSLGLIPGDVVHVLFKNFAGLVVAIKGSRLALGKKLASQLCVKNYDNDWQSNDA